MSAAPGPYRRILVPTDFSSVSEQAWRVARELARTTGAELVLLHVLVEAPLYSESPVSGPRLREVYESAREWATKKLEQWAAEARAAGLVVRVEARAGVPYQDILTMARSAGIDVIVLGTRGRGGVERALLGSVADRVIRLAPCPVLSVRSVEAE
ncbi:MAG TPA: universal stress protein [Methylomirabilota bacterium]|nr:universal stress protein [Methylomirabilota bacterium]